MSDTRLDRYGQPGGGVRQRYALCPAPAAEDETADREPEPERAEREGADRRRLPDARQSLPPPERFFLVARERFAAPFLPQRAPRAEAEIEIVEDLGGLVDHDLSV